MSEKSASTLRCPSCGAPVRGASAESDGIRCEYCRTRLAAVSCPTCFGALFDGTAFCPHCGTPRSRAEQLASEPIRCPACLGEMHWVRVGNTDLLECQGCDGTWIEAVMFERLCADREAQAAVAYHAPSAPPAEGRAGSRAAPDPRADHVRYRPCPRCRKLMNRINFGRLSGAVVDVCRGHGTFLDRGELHQVVRFILEGGMDRTRQAEREQLVEEQHRLCDLERQQARLAPADSSLGWTGSSLQRFLAALFDLG